MAFEVGSVVARIEADTTNFQKGIAEAKNQVSGLHEGITSVGNALTSFSKQAMIFTGVVAAGVGAGITKALDIAGQLEQTQIAFNTLLKDEQKTTEAIAAIKKDAQKSTLFGFNDLAKANQLLISAGENTKDARENVNALSDAIAATGGGNAELSRLAVNLQQIKATGQATSLDIKQFAFAGINIYKLLADSTGKTVDQVKDMNITYEDLTKAIKKANQEGGMFAGASAAQSKSLKGLWEGLKDTINLALADIVGKSGIFDAVKNGLQQLGGFLENATPKIIAFFDSLKTNPDVLAFINFLADAFTKLSDWVANNQELTINFLKGLAVGLGALLILGTVTALLTAFLNPLFLVSMAIAALYVAWQTNFWGIRDITISVFTAISDFWINTFMPAVQVFVDAFTERWVFIQEMLLGVWNFIVGLIQLNWAVISGIIMVGLELLAGDWAGAWERIKQSTSMAWEGIKKMLTGALQFISGWGGMLVSQLVQPFEDAWNKIKDIIAKIRDAADFTKRHSPSVIDVIKNGVNLANKAFQGLEFGADVHHTNMISNVAGASSGTNIGAINVNLEGAVIADEFSAGRVGQAIGDSIIKQLQLNIKF